MVPQVDAACTAQIPLGSGPLGTLVHVPAVPARSQAWHAPVQAPLQQIPCAQKLLRHWLPIEQGAPLGARPQLLMTPPIPQMFGGTHIASVVQAVKHLVPLQW